MKPFSFNSGEMIVSFSFISLPLLVGLIDIGLMKKKRDRVNIFFHYYLLISVAIQGLVTGILQVAAPKIVVSYVQWPLSSYIWELGMANLSYGILGFLSLWMDREWQRAAAAGYGLFLLLTGLGHVVRIIQEGISPGNVGGFLFSDLLIPVILFTLLILQRPKSSF